MMTIILFPREFIIWPKSILAKQVNLETSSLAQSLRDVIRYFEVRFTHFEEIVGVFLSANTNPKLDL